MKKNSLVLICLSLLWASFLPAQEQSVYPQPTKLVTVPTAGIIPRGAYAIEVNLFHDGGLTAAVSAGISQRFMFGVSYGGSRIIGDQAIQWNRQPGAEVKYRFIDETGKMPAILLGFTSRGYGTYLDSLKRYEVKAKGFYVVASKNFRFLGNFGLHGGVNYNPLEKEDGDRDPSFFVGLDKDINSEISIVAEYDAALNDNDTNQLSLGRGYLNAGLRWTMVSGFHLEVDFNNILLNKQGVDYFSRELKVTFIEFF